MNKPPVNTRRLPNWRWRRNPLRRPVDVLEAWVELVATVLLVVSGATAGLMMFVAVSVQLEEQRYEHRPVAAVLLERSDSPTAPPGDGGGPGDARVHAEVRWTDHDGVTRTARALVEPGLATGSEVTLWVDENGRFVPEPPGPGEATGQAALMAVLVAGLVGTAVLLGRRPVDAALDRRRALAWELEWAEYGPLWQQGSGGAGPGTAGPAPGRGDPPQAPGTGPGSRGGPGAPDVPGQRAGDGDRSLESRLHRKTRRPRRPRRPWGGRHPQRPTR